MLNLSMGPPELPATQAISYPIDQTGKSLSDDDQFCNMFKVPVQVPAPRDPAPSLPQLEDAAQRDSGGHSLLLSRAGEAQTQNSPGPQPPSHEDEPGSQHPEQEDWPHKFQPAPKWHMVIPSKTGSNTEEEQTTKGPGLDPLDQELRKDKVTDVLGDYFEEQQTAIWDLIRANPGITGSESLEAMEVDAPSESVTEFLVESVAELPPESVTEAPQGPVTDTQDQAMEVEPTESSPGTFQPELAMPGYTPSLKGRANLPLSPIMAEDNALLDADPDVPGLTLSKVPGAG